jgi:hypothetical protein
MIENELKEKIKTCLTTVAGPLFPKSEFELVMRLASNIEVDFIKIDNKNFSDSEIEVLPDNRFKGKDIGVEFSAIWSDDNNKESDENGNIIKEGRCIAWIEGKYAILDDGKVEIESIEPDDFKYEEEPEWVDKGRFYDISDWINYWKRYDIALASSIMLKFEVEAQTAQRWITEKTVPKSMQSKKDDYDFLYRKNDNVAKKMFDK